jgi:hypothetical protein
MGRRCDITDIFVELQRSTSPAPAVQLALQMLCEAGEYTAALVIRADGRCDAGDGLSFGHPACIRRLAECDATDAFQSAGDGFARIHVISIALTLAGRTVGSLRLAANSAIAAPPQDDYVATLPAVIAALLAATDGGAVPADPRVLGRVQFVEQWSREVSRAVRKGQNVSLVFARRGIDGGDPLACSRTGSAADLSVVAVGLVERLRGGDVVGLIQPSVLGVLLPDTGRVGARIAASRMQSMLPWLDDAGCKDEATPAEWVFTARSYPQDGADADAMFESALAGVLEPGSPDPAKADDTLAFSNCMES